MIEVFKSIPGYEGVYSVSNLGNIRNDIRNKLRATGNNGRNYLFIPLCVNQVKKNFYVHRLVAEMFVENPNDLPCVNHKNGIKSDNRDSNLEWVTYKQNTQHSKEVLGNMIGVKNGSAKLTEEDVLNIREMKSLGIKQIRIAETFNVSKGTISLIVGDTKRKIWGHV